MDEYRLVTPEIRDRDPLFPLFKMLTATLNKHIPDKNRPLNMHLVLPLNPNPVIGPD